MDQATGIKVKLYDDKDNLGLAESFPNINLREKCSSESFEISDLCVLEWTEIWVRIENAEVCEIYFGRERAQKHQNEWRYTFRNYLGKSQIRLQLKDGREITLDGIEVISPKTLDEKSPIFYPKLLKTLFEELCGMLRVCLLTGQRQLSFQLRRKINPLHLSSFYTPFLKKRMRFAMLCKTSFLTLTGSYLRKITE